MAEEQNQQQDGSKTLVSFVVGLLIGGMLVWAFSSPDGQNTGVEVDDADAMEVSEVSEVGAAVESAAGSAVDTVAQGVDSAAGAAAATVANLPVGDGSIVVGNQPASARVVVNRATYPISEGWIGVRDYSNGQLGFILGVVQFSEAANLVPEDIILQTPTVAGRDYAVVVFESDGIRGFNAAGDVQVDKIFSTFTAQ